MNMVPLSPQNAAIATTIPSYQPLLDGGFTLAIREVMSSRCMNEGPLSNKNEMAVLLLRLASIVLSILYIVLRMTTVKYRKITEVSVLQQEDELPDV